jgi:hypothetical protein
VFPNFSQLCVVSNKWKNPHIFCVCCKFPETNAEYPKFLDPKLSNPKDQKEKITKTQASKIQKLQTKSEVNQKKVTQ